MDNKRAQLKCKLLTDSYILQGNRAAFNQHTVDPTCRLCSVAPETRQHFISECSVCERERQEFLDKLRNNPILSGKVKDYMQTPEFLTQLVLDASMVLDPRDIHSEVLDILELQSREYVYKIHQRRITKLKLISQIE